MESRSPRHAVLLGDGSDPVPVGKILGVGRNYREHAREMGASGEEPPLLFLKPPSALVADGGRVLRPAFSRSLHHEVEIVVVIGRGGKHIPEASAGEHIGGYAVGLDMTLRDLQSEAKRQGHPWALAKGFDTSAPLSAVIPAHRVADPSALTVELRVNGALRQRGCAADMILGIPALIAYVSHRFTLEAGDLLFTGTPEGVSEVVPGDVLEATLVGLASLCVTVAEED